MSREVTAHAKKLYIPTREDIASLEMVRDDYLSARDATPWARMKIEYERDAFPEAPVIVSCRCGHPMFHDEDTCGGCIYS